MVEATLLVAYRPVHDSRRSATVKSCPHTLISSAMFHTVAVGGSPFSLVDAEQAAAHVGPRDLASLYKRIDEAGLAIHCCPKAHRMADNDYPKIRFSHASDAERTLAVH